MSTSEIMNKGLELAQSQLHNYEKITNQPPIEQIDIPAPVCAVGDKECTNRWIQAFGDCA